MKAPRPVEDESPNLRLRQQTRLDDESNMAETPNVNNTGAQTEAANGDAAAGPGPSSVPPTATADNATHAGSAAAGPDVTAQLMKMLIAQQQTMQAQQQQAIQAQ
ncbi:hypothetical protein GN244_ATG12571 [Phytophthora infestans]|uniref:Uncharacterized protein n=1 Tax=Phytophthora infestans TaxID=4787 RepID=A0A833S7G3_PHYIN|nr:hypothetical protein GN244_ATG12571 [Phytophthora infestans]KAI9990534.1 hypothetical protein PInf_018088 [Phytophthora infestans]